MMKRLAEFLTQMVASDRGGSSQLLGTSRRRFLEQCVCAAGLGSVDQNVAHIRREDFLSWLKQLKYPQWHLGDLFSRLSLDGSNQLTPDDLTSAFGRGLVSPNRPRLKETPKELHKTDVTYDDPRHRAKVQKTRSACVESVKLGKGRANKNRKPTQPSHQTGWYTDAQSNSKCLNRPDFCGIVHERVNAKGRSHLSRTQSHQVFSRCTDSPIAPGRKPSGQILADFSVDARPPQ